MMYATGVSMAGASNVVVADNAAESILRRDAIYFMAALFIRVGLV